MSNTEIIRTSLWHSHNVDGTMRSRHCRGCWNVIYDDMELRLECNECGEHRNLSSLVEPPSPPAPLETTVWLLVHGVERLSNKIRVMQQQITDQSERVGELENMHLQPEVGHNV
jgi:hypothetical protein